MIFQNKNKIPSETWTHPPNSIVISDFWRKKIICTAPYCLHLLDYFLMSTAYLRSKRDFFRSEEESGGIRSKEDGTKEKVNEF